MLCTKDIKKTNLLRALCYYYTIYCKLNCRRACISSIFAHKLVSIKQRFLSFS